MSLSYIKYLKDAMCNIFCVKNVKFGASLGYTVLTVAKISVAMGTYLLLIKVR